MLKASIDLSREVDYAEKYVQDCLSRFG